jgi:predicted nucleotidyltransferase
VSATLAETKVVAAVRAAIGDVPVLLCGSRATGAATATSDYDLLVVLPRRRIPFTLGRLAALGRTLSAELAAPVTVNPLPAHLARRRRPNLFLWKLQQEARLLSSGPAAAPQRAVAPPTGDGPRFSYLATALAYLIGSLDDGRLATPLPDTVEHATRKALLHLVQLRLLRTGRYASTLDAALAELGDARLTALAAGTAQPSGWLAVRAEVVQELGAISSRRGRAQALRVNARYVLLAAVRGHLRLRAALTLRPIDRRLANVAVELARAVLQDGLVDPAAVLSARRALPRSLRASAGETWASVRDFVLDEWAHAHPLVAQ